MLAGYRFSVFGVQIPSHNSRASLAFAALVLFCSFSCISSPGYAQEPDGDQAGQLVPDSIVDSNSGLLESMNSMDRVLAGDKETRDPIRDRLVAVAILGGAFLALLGVLFFYLRVDHASRGFYSGRLQMISVIAVIIILAVCYLLWTQVVFQ